MNKINWENKDVKINGQYLFHLISADDILLIANSTSKLQEMLQDIHDISKTVGLKMHWGKTEVMQKNHVKKDDVIVDLRRLRKSIDISTSGWWWLRTMSSCKKWKGESDRVIVHYASWTTWCETKSVSETEKENIQQMYAFRSDIWLWDLVAQQHPTRETNHYPMEDEENHREGDPQEQKEYKLDPKTEWCDRHHQEYNRKHKQMGGTHGEEKWHQMDNQPQNG